MGDVSWFLSYVDNVDVAKSNVRDAARDNLPHYMTIAELRATHMRGTRAVIVNGVATFILDPLDTTTADDGASVIVSSNGGRYKIAAVAPGALDPDLVAIQDLSSTGIPVRTAANTWAQRSLVQPSEGLAITNPAGIAGNFTFSLANDLAALEAFSSTGFPTRTAADTWAQRSLVGTANAIEVTDGSGVGGNPTFNLSATLTFTGKTINGGTFASPAAITGLPDPTNPQDAATKAYVDATRQGLDPKASVRVATTANITLSGTQTIDGVSVVAADRVLVKNQSTGSQNGIYVCAAGSWTRADDFDNWAEIPGAYCWVEEGTLNGDSAWTCTNNAGGTLGSTSITWQLFAYAGGYTNGFGLGLTGSQFSINDPELVAIAGLTSAADKGIYFTGSGSASTFDLTSFARSILDDANAGAVRSTLGLVIGTDVQAYHARLADIAGITFAQGDLLYYNGSALVKLGAGTSGQFLRTNGAGANPSWDTPAGGGGGASTDDLAPRDMILADALNTIADLFNGFADSFDVTTGVDAVNSTNYLTSEAGVIKPTVTTNFSQSSATGQAGTANSGLTIADGTYSLTNGETVNAIGFYNVAAVSAVVKIIKYNSAGNYDVVASESFSHPGGGMSMKTLAAPYVVPGSGTYYVAIYSASARNVGGTVGSRIYKSGDITGTGQTGFTEDSSAAKPVTRAEYASQTVGAMDLRLVARDIYITPTTVSVYARITETDALTPDTDLTLYATRNGGTTWTSGGATKVGTIGTQQFWKATITVSGQSSGDDIAARFVSANNKNFKIDAVAIYGAA